MEYFVNSEDRKNSKSTAYLEFFAGNWDMEDGHWNETSIFISDETWYDLSLGRLIKSVVSNFDVCGVTTIGDMQWSAIVAVASLVGGKVYEAIIEADKWASKCLIDHTCFTILGL